MDKNEQAVATRSLYCTHKPHNYVCRIINIIKFAHVIIKYLYPFNQMRNAHTRTISAAHSLRMSR